MIRILLLLVLYFINIINGSSNEIISENYTTVAIQSKQQIDRDLQSSSQQFSSIGTYTYTIPDDAPNYLFVQMWGAG